MTITIVWIIGLVILVLVAVLGITDVAYTESVHRKLKREISRLKVEGQLLDPESMLAQFQDDLPNRVALAWADSFFRIVMAEKFSESEKAIIFRGLYQKSLEGRWAFVRKFLAD